MKSKLNIVSCDLAIRNSGLVHGTALMDGGKLTFGDLRSKVICTSPPLKGMDGFTRLGIESENAMEIADEIRGLVFIHPKNSVVVIETPYASRSAKSAVLLGMCWMIGEVLKKDGIDVFRIHPLACKEYITGNRQASKMEVKNEMIRRFNLINEHSDHVVDAYAAMVTFLEQPFYSERVWRQHAI